MTTDDDEPRERRLGMLFWAGLAGWGVAFWWYLSRTSMWFLDLVLDPLMAGLYLFGLAAVTGVLVRRRRWGMLAAVVPVLAVLAVFVNAMWAVAPRAWFSLHRPLFERALATDPGDDYYGTALPWPTSYVSVNGRVSNANGSRFFPQRLRRRVWICCRPVPATVM